MSVVWKSNLPDPIASWAQWMIVNGAQNVSYPFDPDLWRPCYRVFLPGGSYSGSGLTNGMAPGVGYRANVMPNGSGRASLSYRVRFQDGFKFGKGGKLPGLYGGTGAGGGVVPNGTDGFSMRLMFESGGCASVYAYLPTSTKWGTSVLAHELQFIPGRWHRVEQEVKLNTPGQADGSITMRIDDVTIGTASGLVMRTVPTLKINGVYGDCFFGGSTPDWACPQDQHVDFADFAIDV